MRKIAILNLPFRGNEEFQPILGDPGLEAARVSPLEFDRRFKRGADLIILPGSSETVSDLIYLQESGGINLIRQHLSSGGSVMGICGGFQILGERLHDPFFKQGPVPETSGLGFLPIETYFGKKMLHCKTKAEMLENGALVTGIEGRSGVTIALHNSADKFSPLLKIKSRQELKPIPAAVSLPSGFRWAPGTESLDGFLSRDRRIWGTYLHLIFHNKAFMEALLRTLSCRS